MNPLAPFLLAGINLCLVILLAADKWVHRVTGPSSLEARVKMLEETMNHANIRFSDKMSDLTKYLEMRRTDQDQTRTLVAELQGELRVMRDHRKTDG